MIKIDSFFGLYNPGYQPVIFFLKKTNRLPSKKINLEDNFNTSVPIFYKDKL